MLIIKNIKNMNMFDYDDDCDEYDEYDEKSEEDEDLKKAIEASLDIEFDKIVELSKNNDLELFSEELQLEAAIKLSLSTKQPLYQRPIGKIYNIDNIFKDTIFNLLIDRGCLKDLYSFCTTRWHYYEIIRRERYKINDKLLSLRQIHLSLIKLKIYSFEGINSFELLDKLGNKIFTKQYYVVANSDKCGCVTKNTILYIKIPAVNEQIIIGRTKNNKPKIFSCKWERFFHKKDKEELKPGANSNKEAVTLLNSCVYDERCNEILKSGY